MPWTSLDVVRCFQSTGQRVLGTTVISAVWPRCARVSDQGAEVAALNVATCMSQPADGLSVAVAL